MMLDGRDWMGAMLCSRIAAAIDRKANRVLPEADDALLLAAGQTVVQQIRLGLANFLNAAEAVEGKRDA